MRKNILFFLFVFTIGCSSNTPRSSEMKPFYSKDGKLAHTVFCPQSIQILLSDNPDLTVCKQKAGAVCKTKGYKILSIEKPSMTHHIYMRFQCNGRN